MASVGQTSACHTVRINRNVQINLSRNIPRIDAGSKLNVEWQEGCDTFTFCQALGECALSTPNDEYFMAKLPWITFKIMPQAYARCRSTWLEILLLIPLCDLSLAWITVSASVLLCHALYIKEKVLWARCFMLLRVIGCSSVFSWECCTCIVICWNMDARFDLCIKIRKLSLNPGITSWPPKSDIICTYPVAQRKRTVSFCQHFAINCTPVTVGPPLLSRSLIATHFALPN